MSVYRTIGPLVCFCGHFPSLLCQIKFVCVQVAICDLVHDVETVHGLCVMLTASGNLV